MKGFRWSPYAVIKDNLFHPVERRPKPFIERTIIIDDFLDRRRWFTPGKAIGKSSDAKDFPSADAVAATEGIISVPKFPEYRTANSNDIALKHVEPSINIPHKGPLGEKEEKLDDSVDASLDQSFEGNNADTEVDTSIDLEEGTLTDQYPRDLLKNIVVGSKLVEDDSTSVGVKYSQALDAAQDRSYSLIEWARETSERLNAKGQKTGAVEIKAAADYLSEVIRQDTAKKTFKSRVALYTRLRNAMASVDKKIKEYIKYT